MAKPLAIVVSDLHLGEDNSVLYYGDQFEAGKQPFVNRFKRKIEKYSQNKTIPCLIMAGDTMDFSLASVHDAIADFRKFLKDVNDMFDNFVYIPGNHDHHIWLTLQEQVFVVNRIRENGEIQNFPQEQIGTIKDGKITLNNIDPKKTLGEKTFLNDLLPKEAKKKNFAVTYPNLFWEFKKSEQNKNILITHGHFFEEAWTLVSDVFKKSLNLTTIDYKVLERINSPLTEFGWYGIGQAGKLSQFIEELYLEIKNSEDRKLSLAVDDIRNYIDELWTFKPEKKQGFLSRIRNAISELRSGAQERMSDIGLKVATDFLKHLIISQVEEREACTGGSPLRHFPNILDSEDKRTRIRNYISYSFNRPYEFVPGQIIFGHTHMPIRNGSLTMTAQGRVLNANAFNTGGWVVDSENAGEIIQSRPMPFVVSDVGDIEPIDISWPTDEKDIENKEMQEVIKFIHKGKFS